MLLSLLETILVTYLMEKQSQRKQRDRQTRVQTENCNPGETKASSDHFQHLSHSVPCFQRPDERPAVPASATRQMVRDAGSSCLLLKRYSTVYTNTNTAV